MMAEVHVRTNETIFDHQKHEIAEAEPRVAFREEFSNRPSTGVLVARKITTLNDVSQVYFAR